MQMHTWFGWFPAVILPVSTWLQLRQVLRASSVAGVSVASWALFAVANLGAYIYTGRPWAVQSLLAFLLTAILDVAIVVVVLRRRTREAATISRASGNAPL